MNFEERLIREVKKRNLLYTPSSKDYRNPTLRDQEWKKIAIILGSDFESCKKKWRSLRDQYIKIRRREEVEMRLGRNDAGCQRRWKYAKYLGFLDKCDNGSKQTKTDTEAFEDESALNDSLQDDTADSYAGLKESYDEDIKVTNDADNAEENEEDDTYANEPEFFKCDPYSESTMENHRYSFEGEEDVITPQDTETEKTSLKKPEVTLEKCLMDTMNSVQNFLKRPRYENSSKKTQNYNDDSEDELFCHSMMRKLKKFPLKQKNEAKISILRYLSIKESDLDGIF